jgi:hypothetical protein
VPRSISLRVPLYLMSSATFQPEGMREFNGDELQSDERIARRQAVRSAW